MDRERRARAQRSQPPRAAVLSAAAGALVLVLGLYARHARPSILDTPFLDSGARLYYLLAFVAAAGLGWHIHRAYDLPPAGYTPYPPLPTVWILPALTVLGAALLVARYHTAPIVVMAAVLAGTGTFAALSLREVFRDEHHVEPMMQAVHVGLSLVVGFVVIALVLQYQARLAVTLPAVFMVTALLLLQIHDGIPTYPVRRQAYALVGALIAGEVVWPLTYWPPMGWWAGAVVASVITGYALVTRANLLRRLTPVSAVQYAGLTAAMLVFVIAMSR